MSVCRASSNDMLWADRDLDMAQQLTKTQWMVSYTIWLFNIAMENPL